MGKDKERCPNCGYCPHCGRSDRDAAPVKLVPYWGPYYPIWYTPTYVSDPPPGQAPTITCGSTDPRENVTGTVTIGSVWQ